MDASHSQLSRDSIDESTPKQHEVEPANPDKKESDANLFEDAKSDKAQSQDEKDDKENPLDIDSDRGSNKCKSVSKKMIKLPKNSKRYPQKMMTSTFAHYDEGKSHNKLSMYRSLPKKSNKLRTMKSMSPRKRFYKNSNLHMSMDGISMATSQGFKTDFQRPLQRRGNTGVYRSLMTLQRAGPGSYNLPPLIGTLSVDANKINNPRYSIGKADKFAMKVMDKSQLSAAVGQHSPGVGRYSPDVNKFRESSPSTKIGREKRFIEFKQ